MTNFTFLQLMKPCRWPMKTLVLQLARYATYHNPRIDGAHCVGLGSKSFAGELKLMRMLGTMDIPPNTVKEMYKTTKQTKLVCEGYTLTNK